VNNLNYEKMREEQIKNGLFKSKLLLHSCCAPCSTACIERLADCFDVTVYYYNPNILSREEYYKRALEQERFLKQVHGTVRLIVEEYNHEEFLQIAKGLEHLPERGERCEKCFDLRLKKTLDYAKANSFDAICTTLTLSPLKDAKLLNAIGERLCLDSGVSWVYSDFKKSGGYLRSVELSKKYGLYRQNYCGCEFSLR